MLSRYVSPPREPRGSSGTRASVALKQGYDLLAGRHANQSIAEQSVTSERLSGTRIDVPSSERSAPIGYEHVIDRVDSKECPLINPTIPLTLNAVTTRELVLGCNAFEEYLSPNFETIFVLNEEMARTWRIDTLVRGATCDQTLGAHLFLLDNFGGEWLGRRVAVDFTLCEMNVSRGSVQFLNQMNCDVRALPKDHVHSRSIDCRETFEGLQCGTSPEGACKIHRRWVSFVSFGYNTKRTQPLGQIRHICNGAGPIRGFLPDG